MQTVVETSVYLKNAQKLGLSDDERKKIVDFLALNPEAGEEMQGTVGARKVRIASPGKGKSGGYRVVTFYSGSVFPVFLMTIYAKGDRANLTPKERNALKKTLAALLDVYRSKRHV